MLSRLFLLLSFISICLSFPPGFQATISQNAVTYLKDVGLPILVQELQSIDVPDITGKTDTPVGKIDYTLNHIHLTGLSIPASDSTVVITSDGLGGEIKNSNAKGKLDWHYKEEDWPHVSDDGSADITVKDITVKLVIAVGTEKGRPFIQGVKADVDIGDLDIDLHGGASWLYQIFVDIFKPLIVNEAENALTSALQGQIAKDLNHVLASIPVTTEVGWGVDINYGLVGGPTFTKETRFVTYDAGEFFQKSNPSDRGPFLPVPLPPSLTNDMMQIFFSTYFANSAAYSFYKLGLIQHTLVQSDLPPDFPLALNTSSFCDLVPKLCRLYPDDAMTVFLNETAIPYLNISSNMGLGTLEGDAIFNVILPNKTSVPVFGMNVSLSLTGNASIAKGNMIVGQVDYLKSFFTLKFSQVGEIPVKLLTTLVNSLLEKFIIPKINSIIGQGTQIPTVEGLTLVNPKVGYGKEYFYVTSDIKYSPN